MSDTGFYRTELRVLKARAKDETEFLNTVAKMLYDITYDRDTWKDRAENAEYRLRESSVD